MLFARTDAPPPPSSPPPTGTTPIARAIGSVDLNDRVHTFWDRFDEPGTRTLQAEQLENHDGEMTVVKVDRKKLEMTVYLQFHESPDLRFETWKRNLEDATAGGVPFWPGDGRVFTTCWASDIVGTPSLSKGLPGSRWMRVSFKVSSRYTSWSAA